MRRRLKILACVLAVLVVAWAVPILVVNVIENKKSVDPRELIRDSPASYPILGPLKWTGQKVVPNADGVYVRSWSSGRIRLIQGVHQYGSSISAFFAFSTQGPLLVHDATAAAVGADPPSGLRADQAALFCSHLALKRGHSQKCVAWNAWLRYGQYTVYFGISNATISGADFASITQHVDAGVDQALLSEAPSRANSRPNVHRFHSGLGFKASHAGTL